MADSVTAGILPQPANERLEFLMFIESVRRRWSLMRTRLLAAALLLACVNVSRAQDAVLIVDRTGWVFLSSPGTPRPLSVLSTLPSGARVRLGAAATLTLLYVSSGDEYMVSGPGGAEVGATSVSSLDGALLQRRAAQSTPRVRLNGDAIAQGSIVMRATRLRARYPAGLALSQPDRLIWDSLAADAPYRVELRDAAGSTMFEARVEGLSIALPQGLHFLPDAVYRWSVSPDSGAPDAPASVATFQLAPADLERTAAANRPADTATRSDRLIYALWLEQVGATGDARRGWQQLAAERPDEEALQARARR